MRDRPIDYETVRRARDEGATSHKVWQDVCARIYCVVVALLGAKSPDCRDVSQDALLDVYHGLDDFKGGSFDSWIRRVAETTTLDHCRRSQVYARIFSHDDEAGEEAEYHGPYALTQLERFQDEQRLNAAFDALAPEFRITIYLRFREGKSVHDVAAELGVPEGTVKSRCSRGAQLIREHIEAASTRMTDPKRSAQT
jgi:RNA polymerase sigma-70 factor, ECF subfamily